MFQSAQLPDDGGHGGGNDGRLHRSEEQAEHDADGDEDDSFTGHGFSAIILQNEKLPPNL